MPGCLLSRYSPVPGVSVPFCCVTRYCSGESLGMASGSLLNFLISFSSCRTCMEGTPRVRAGPTQLSRRNQPGASLSLLPLRLVNCSGTNRLLLERCQPRAVIGDVHSEQGRRLFCARILTDEMATSGRLKEAFTGLVDFDRSGRGIFGTDRPREHISDDAFGVMMWT